MKNVVRALSVIMQLGLHGTGIRIPFILIGPSGVGKTIGFQAICAAVSVSLNRPFACEVYSGPQMQAEDVGGLPVPNFETRHTELWPLRVGLKCEEALLKGGAGAIAIDEFGSLTNSQEAVNLNLMHGGVLGEKILDTSIALGAMGNPVNVAANGRELSGPAANRFAWFEWTLPPSIWVDYMTGGQGFAAYIEVLPKGWEVNIPKTMSRVAQYIKRNSEALHKMPPPHNAGCAWPSPRSWENAAILCAAVEACGETSTSDLSALILESCVGDHAEPYIAWLVDMKLPDPEDLLADPDNAHLLFPSRNDQLQVTMDTLAAACCESDRPDWVERWNTGWKILGPVLTRLNDVAIGGAKQMALKIPPGAEFPKEARLIKPILKQAGIIKDSV
jgi:hypothetical protein